MKRSGCGNMEKYRIIIKKGKVKGGGEKADSTPEFYLGSFYVIFMYSITYSIICTI